MDVYLELNGKTWRKIPEESVDPRFMHLFENLRVIANERIEEFKGSFTAFGDDKQKYLYYANGPVFGYYVEVPNDQAHQGTA